MVEVNIAQLKKHKKSYYKSRKKEYFRDMETFMWYFITNGDPTRSKFCYVMEKTVKIGNDFVAVDIETFRLHKPGSYIVPFDVAVKIQKDLLISNPSFKKKVDELRMEHQRYLKDVDIQFSKDYRKEIDEHNSKVANLIASYQVCRL